MKMFTILFILYQAFLVGLPCYPKEHRNYFVAAFVNPGFEACWENTPIDTMYVPHSWKDFPEFLIKAKHDAGDMPIVLDIDVHGNDDGLIIGYDDKATRYRYIASMGYVLNLIDQYMDVTKVTVVTEACYSGRAYKNTIRGNDIDWNEENPHEDHQGIPVYPIYGIGSATVNRGVYIFLQYTHPYYRKRFEDLRQYECLPLQDKEPPDGISSFIIRLDLLELLNLERVAI